MFAPNTIIENLLQQKMPQAAMTLDALYAADIVAWPDYDFAAIMGQILERGLNVGESIIRKGLRQLVALGVMSTKRIMLRTKGRPAWLYRLGSLSSMAKILGVELRRDEFADSIPNQGFKSVRAYRASKHYALIKRAAGRYSRKWLGERLGVTRRTTANYEKGTDIEVIQMIDREFLKDYDIQHAPSKRISGRFFIISEYERDMTEEELSEIYKDFTADQRSIMRRKTTVQEYLPYTKYILKRELDKGHRVYKAWQTTNSYS